MAHLSGHAIVALGSGSARRIFKKMCSGVGFEMLSNDFKTFSNRNMITCCPETLEACSVVDGCNEAKQLLADNFHCPLAELLASWNKSGHPERAFQKRLGSCFQRMLKISSQKIREAKVVYEKVLRPTWERAALQQRSCGALAVGVHELHVGKRATHRLPYMGPQSAAASRAEVRRVLATKLRAKVCARSWPFQLRPCDSDVLAH